jgi:single-strand DNA-binding protein
MNLNKVTIAGNLTRDPELRFSPKGLAICKFGVAINRTWKGESGDQKEEATFIDVDGFGRTAEAVAQYFKKGKPIYVEGRLKLDQWDDKQSGQKRSKLGVVMESFQFVGGKSESEPAASPSPRKEHDPQPPPLPPVDDDVPF